MELERVLLALVRVVRGHDDASAEFAVLDQFLEENSDGSETSGQPAVEAAEGQEGDAGVGGATLEDATV